MTPEKNANAGTRLGAMILDHFLMTMICVIFFIPTIIQGFAGAFTISHEQKDIGGGFNGPLFYLGLFGFALYFCKDCINGRSIAKRIIKLQVVDNKTGQVASPLKCFIRNIFCIIWPVEVIVVLLKPGRRIGDQVAGTKVMLYEPALVEQQKVDIKKLLVPFALAFALLILVTLPIQSIQSSIHRVKYIESSYNDTESKALEKLYSDSLGQNLNASVRVYDKIENQNIKYISIIYRLKENYLDDPVSSRELKKVTTQYLSSVFPENTFTGQAQYVYKEGGNMQVSSNQIGTPVSQTMK
jgi:uncharacterized RDD family membrane protein YckC